MIDTVIFDFDGTIADTNQIVKNSFKHVFNKYGKEYDEAYILSTFGEPLKSVLSRDFGKNNVEEVLSTYREYHANKFEEEVRLYDTVYDTVENLAKKGKKLGVVTSRLKDSTIKGLHIFNLLPYFSSIVAVDDVENPKPHGEPLLKIISHLDSCAKNTVYVGDTAIDILCANNAGVTPVLVGWHKHSQAIAEEHNVKYVLDKMCSLIDLLKTI